MIMKVKLLRGSLSFFPGDIACGSVGATSYKIFATYIFIVSGYTAVNTTAAMVSQIIAILVGYLTRVVFTRTLSEDYVGINGLFTDILWMLWRMAQEPLQKRFPGLIAREK